MAANRPVASVWGTSLKLVAPLWRAPFGHPPCSFVPSFPNAWCRFVSSLCSSVCVIRMITPLSCQLLYVLENTCELSPVFLPLLSSFPFVQLRSRPTVHLGHGGCCTQPRSWTTTGGQISSAHTVASLEAMVIDCGGSTQLRPPLRECLPFSAFRK